MSGHRLELRRAPWGPGALSVSFLTVLPMPRVEPAPRSLAGAVALFPLVGVALGAAIGALGLLLDRVLPPGPAAALVLAAGVVLTGGLHLDGLMDTADGIGGGRTPQRRLAIMRDSRIGAFGAMAGGLVLLAQYACLAELSGGARLTALVTAHGLSRWLMAAAIALFPPARPDGLGATFRAGASGWAIGVATAIAAGIAFVMRPSGIIGFIIAALILLTGGTMLARRLSGLTGDTYGALAAVAETAILFGVLAGRA